MPSSTPLLLLNRDEVESLLPPDISLAAECNAAVAASDAAVTATPGAGAHLNCVGANTRGTRERPEGLLARVRPFVDDPAPPRQSGEAQWAPAVPCVALGDLLTGKAHYSPGADDIRVFETTGFALPDLTVARRVQLRADAVQAGTRVEWPW